MQLKTLIFRFTLVSVREIRYFRPRQLASSFWNAGVVQDFVQLERDQVIDLRDARIDHRLRIPRKRHVALPGTARRIP